MRFIYLFEGQGHCTQVYFIQIGEGDTGSGPDEVSSEEEYDKAREIAINFRMKEHEQDREEAEYSYDHEDLTYAYECKELTED